MFNCVDCGDIDISTCGSYANRDDTVREIGELCAAIEAQQACTVIANIPQDINFCDNTIINTVWPDGAPSADCCETLTVYAADGSCFWTRGNGFTTCWIRTCFDDDDCFAVVPDGTLPEDFYEVGFPSGCNPSCSILIVTNASGTEQWITRACSTNWQLITNYDCWAETNFSLSIEDYCNTLFTSPERSHCSSLAVAVTDTDEVCFFVNDGSDCTNPANWICTSNDIDCSIVEACPGIFTSCDDVTPCITIADCSDVLECVPPPVFSDCSDVLACVPPPVFSDCSDVLACLPTPTIADCDDVRACIIDDGCAAWGDNTGAPFSQNYTVDSVVDADLGTTVGTYGSGCVVIDHDTGEIEFLTAGLYCISASLQARMENASCGDYTNTRIDFFFNGPASYSYQTALYSDDHSGSNSILSISVCFYVTVPLLTGTFTLAGGGPAMSTCAIEAAVQFWSVVRIA